MKGNMAEVSGQLKYLLITSYC